MKTKLSYMTLLAFSAAILGLTALNSGCTKETDVGGPGASSTGSGTADRDNASEETFQLVMPSGEIDITQGETQALQIGIERGGSFDQAVSVKLMAPIEGLTLSPDTATFSGDTDELEFSLVAAADAPVGKTTVTLIGNPGSGESVNGIMTVRINDDE